MRTVGCRACKVKGMFALALTVALLSQSNVSCARIGYGTAFHVEVQGYFVTNFHVIEGGKRIEIHKAGLECDALVVAKDKVNDLAVLQVDYECLDVLKIGPPLQLGEPGSVAVGTDVVTFGYPLPTEFQSQPQVSRGIVKSKTGFGGDARTLTISNTIQPGNSGGPLFGPDGRVIAVVTSTANVNYLFPRYAVIPQGLNFAVRGEYIRAVYQINGITASETNEDPVSISVQPLSNLPGFVAEVESSVVLVKNFTGGSTPPRTSSSLNRYRPRDKQSARIDRIYDQLPKLDDLRQRGMITDEDYEKAKTKLFEGQLRSFDKVYSQFLSLYELHRREILTYEEYDREKRELLQID